MFRWVERETQFVILYGLLLPPCRHKARRGSIMWIVSLRCWCGKYLSTLLGHTLPTRNDNPLITSLFLNASLTTWCLSFSAKSNVGLRYRRITSCLRLFWHLLRLQPLCPVQHRLRSQNKRVYILLSNHLFVYKRVVFFFIRWLYFEHWQWKLLRIGLILVGLFFDVHVVIGWCFQCWRFILVRLRLIAIHLLIT